MNEREVFGLFFGVFWAAVQLSAARYRLFDTHSLRPGGLWRFALPRFAVGVAVLNLAPIVLFAWLAVTLPEASGIVPSAAGALAALSAFGFQRVAHAIVFTEWKDKFYTTKEQEWFRESWHREDEGGFWPHLIAGLLYIAIPPLLAIAVLPSWA